jgi:AAA+ ATPase superfamily predicted ATPase
VTHYQDVLDRLEQVWVETPSTEHREAIWLAMEYLRGLQVLAMLEEEALEGCLPALLRVLQQGSRGARYWQGKPRSYHLAKALKHLGRLGKTDTEGITASGVDHGYNAAVRVLMAVQANP